MTAMAARTHGLLTCTCSIRTPNCAASAVADRVVAAKFDDADAAADLARHCDVVTLEIEQIGVDALAAATRHAPVRPGPRHPRASIQDRAQQKRGSRDTAFRSAPTATSRARRSSQRAARELGPLFVKACRGGYDGRSQARVAIASPRRPTRGQSLGERALGRRAGARPRGGAVGDGRATSERRSARLSAVAQLSRAADSRVVGDARAACRAIARSAPRRSRAASPTQFALEGILAVEMFLLDDGTLLVNELAPRPHNSFHETEVACSTSQFEQLVRAVCDLPLGDPSVLRPGAIFNLFGELWERRRAAASRRALAQPGVRLHLYGKRGARAGRKMGHLSATGDTAEDALARVTAARRSGDRACDA